VTSPSLTLLRLLASRDPARLMASFYRFADPIFEAVTRGSGLINVGMAPDPASADLAQAQRDLVLHAVRGLPLQGPGGGPARWLETGCGWGGPAALLASTHPHLQIHALDISPEHAAAARARTARFGPRIRVHLGDAQHVPFPAESFDGVYAIESAFHYPRKAEYPREARRLLRPGGVLAIADFVQRPEHTGSLEALALGPNMRIGAMPGLSTPGGWVRAFEDAGLVEVEIEDITPQVIGLLGRWAQRIREERERLLSHYPRPLLAYYTLGLDALAARGARAPIGYVVVRGRRA
jgi:cyclopropane fatty-acyl-phospholipid synthase-like methyltransferase